MHPDTKKSILVALKLTIHIFDLHFIFLILAIFYIPILKKQIKYVKLGWICIGHKNCIFVLMYKHVFLIHIPFSCQVFLAIFIQPYINLVLI